MSDKMLTPPEMAKMLRVSNEKVRGWIRSGHLTAFNISQSWQPRFRIRASDLEAFIKRKQVLAESPLPRRRQQISAEPRLPSRRPPE